jgi:hypothetical protein
MPNAHWMFDEAWISRLQSPGRRKFVLSHHRCSDQDGRLLAAGQPSQVLSAGAQMRNACGVGHFPEPYRGFDY